MKDETLLLMWNVGVTLCLILLVLHVKTMQNNQGYFNRVPASDIHTMRVYEDGSFQINYKDKGLGQTSEVGCLPGGGCND